MDTFFDYSSESFRIPNHITLLTAPEKPEDVARMKDTARIVNHQAIQTPIDVSINSINEYKSLIKN